ncbi:aspartate aminotransferase family protein [Candidatus Anaplasma sp. TIGMIC]|uniref:aspartate aminotransferase family protein n=1 Tax=Candidatus Anaplasma sp. TIGMIC TaxID=3020713 RepID=UPI00232CCC70|nr:aspartate aminotransferase family protein [Candidatus Anaplasma sp. TIGMIC]MDB1135052.1 aspartate aminotransferase family protein [Candidatus Anaplasma sp. TIGMIC]
MDRSFMIPFYTPFDISFVRGEGVYLYDGSGKRYLDFSSGRGANALGHCHPVMVEALGNQASKLWHVSNTYKISEAELLAEELVRISFADMAFFVNSGAEAVECGLKVIRSYQNGIGHPERYKVITLRRAFHGRTYATCSANEPKGFLPMLYPYVDWFVSVSPDIDSIRLEVEKGNIGGILLEPIQGEGGIHVLESNLLRELRALCDQHDILLFFDCVQCGSGRTGKFFAYEHSGVTPDVCALAKGLGGGFPIGGCIITERAGRFVTPRMHGSTCGGNPLAVSVAHAIVREVLKPQFMEDVAINGSYLMKRFYELSEKYKLIKEVRGMGLLIGLEIDSTVPVCDMAASMISHGLLSAPASGNVLRMVPPLIVTRSEIDEFLQTFERFLEVYTPHVEDRT